MRPESRSYRRRGVPPPHPTESPWGKYLGARRNRITERRRGEEGAERIRQRVAWLDIVLSTSGRDVGLRISCPAAKGIGAVGIDVENRGSHG